MFRAAGLPQEQNSAPWLVAGSRYQAGRRLSNIGKCLTLSVTSSAPASSAVAAIK